jgi:hypothetical protein
LSRKATLVASAEAMARIRARVTLGHCAPNHGMRLARPGRPVAARPVGCGVGARMFATRSSLRPPHPTTLSSGGVAYERVGVIPAHIGYIAPAYSRVRFLTQT